MIPKQYLEDVSANAGAISIARTFLVCCVGIPRPLVHGIRASYHYGISDSSALLEKARHSYQVHIIGLYNQNTYDEILMRVLPLKPSLLMLGSNFKAPYSHDFKELVYTHRPSLLRVDKERRQPKELSDEDYWLGVYGAYPERDLLLPKLVSKEIDYGILINLNAQRCVDTNDMRISIDSDSNYFKREMIESAVPCGC